MDLLNANQSKEIAILNNENMKIIIKKINEATRDGLASTNLKIFDLDRDIRNMIISKLEDAGYKVDISCPGPEYTCYTYFTISWAN